MQLSAWHLGSCIYSRVCSLQSCSCCLLETLPDMQKWSWRPSVRWKVCFIWSLNSSLADSTLTRYCNIDFNVLATLISILLLQIILTYDVACQWSKNLQKHIADFLPEMQILETMKLDIAIPRWHINRHGETCRNNFNISYMEGAGRMVGKDIETVWAGTNLLAPSIQEMGPAARHDMLNDHWNGWNFRKIIWFHRFFIIWFSFYFLIKIWCQEHLF